MIRIHQTGSGMSESNNMSEAQGNSGPTVDEVD